MIIIKQIGLMLIAGTLLIGQLALAHTAHKADRAPHNGQVLAADNYFLELVIQNQNLTLYVTDQKWAVTNVDGAKARAILLSNKKKNKIQLTPSGEGMLVGEGSFISSEGMKVIITLELPGQSKLTARFTPQ